jgi:flagellar capping protein FliD
MDDKFVSLPIPRADSGDFYKNLIYSLTDRYIKVMKQLGINLYSEAHLDPDLQKSILKERPEKWRGLFGQAGTSQGTLHNRDVGKGDIFLFFGWFREARKVNGNWKYCSDAPDVHAIFGYLEVDRVLDIKARNPVPSWTKLQKKYEQDDDMDEFMLNLTSKMRYLLRVLVSVIGNVHGYTSDVNEQEKLFKLA